MCGARPSVAIEIRIEINGNLPPPTVSSVAVTSTPSAASDTYGVGEEIEFTVTFSRAVEVSTGRPHFEFYLGNSGVAVIKDAAYQSGSGTTALVFAYTVVAADMDDNGIWVGDQSETLMLDTGEYIRAVDDQTSATLTHAELGTQSGHKVDGSLMVTASTDATLSALALTAGTTSTAVALSPVFASGTTTGYRAWVANSVSSVTVTATKNDSNATVAIADDDDAGTPGSAVLSLSGGRNTITVTVTAEDGSTTKTYTATAVRVASAPTADPNALLTANVTVGETSGVFGYFQAVSPGWGAMTDNDFVVGGSTYRLWGVLVMGDTAVSAFPANTATACFTNTPAPPTAAVRDTLVLSIDGHDFPLAGTTLLPGASTNCYSRSRSALTPWAWGDIATVKIASLNNAPVFAAEASTRELTENVGANVNVGAPVRATDGDGDMLSYSFGGTDAESFDFNASTQQITTKTGVTYDYETKASYTVTVTATDGTTPTTVTVTIDVLDLPAVSIAPEQARFLLAGGHIEFVMSVSPMPSTDLTVPYSAQQEHAWSPSLAGNALYLHEDNVWAVPTFNIRANAPAQSGEFAVTLKPGDGYELGTATATVAIVAADPVITVRAAASYSAGEGDGTVTVTLTAETIADAPQPSNLIRVNWSTTADTATGGGTDFANGNGTVRFPSADFAPQGDRWVSTLDVEVTLVDDTVVEETEQFHVTLTRGTGLHPLVKLANADRSLCTGNAAGVNCGTTVNILDDDPGVKISKTALNIVEGGTGAYTVVLRTEPTATVTVTPSRSSGDADITVSGVLTFTTTTWDDPQTVTVSAAEDSDSVVDTAVIGHAVSGGDYASVMAASVAVSAADNDAPDVPATGKPTISGTAQVGRTLTAAKGSIADGNGLTKADNDETGFAYAHQWIRVDSDGTSNPVNVGTSSTYTVAALDEDKKIKVEVSFHDDNGYAETRTSDAYPSSDTVLPSSAVSLLLSAASIRENGGTTVIRARLNVESSAETTVAVSVEPVPPAVAGIRENGGTTVIRARLNVESSAETTVAVSVEPVPPAVAGDYTLSANTVLTIAAGRTFSTGRVTLTAVNNDVDADDKTVAIRGDAENSAGVGGPAEQTLTIEDDDRGVRLSTRSLAIDEGRSKSYTVVLGSRPAGSVTVTPQDPPGMVTVSGPLVFTQNTWNEPQTVTVTAGQDEDDEDETVEVTHLVSGADYGGFTAGSVRVVVSDDDGGTGVLEVGVYDGSAGAGVKDPPPRVHFGQRFRIDLVWSHLRTKHWDNPEGAIGPTRAIRATGGTVRAVRGRFSPPSKGDHGWDQSRLTLEVTPVPSADSDDVTVVLEPLDCSSNDPKALCSLDRGRWTGLAKRVRFTVRGITGAPVMAAAELNLTVTPQERRGKDLFLVSFDADEEGTRFRLQMQEAGGDWSRKSEWTGAMRSENQHRVTVDGVSHDDAYQFRVRWENRFGNGPWAQASTAGAAPTAPTGLRLTPMYQDKSLALAWTPVTQAGVRIERFQYRIDRTRSEELVILSDTGPMQYRGDWVDIPNSGRGNANYRSWTIGGLANMWAARIRVRAVSASGRAGAASAEAVAPLDVPRVADISMASDPGQDGYYTYENKIGINVRLSRPVRIPGNDQRPSLDVEIGGGVYSMGLVSIRQSVAHELIGQAPWSGDVLLFEHSLGTGDSDHNGIRVPAGALRGNDGRLLDVTPAGEDQLADLAVSTAKVFPAHRVNTVPPGIVRMTWQQNLDAKGVVRGAEVRIHYDRDLDPNSRLNLDWVQYRVAYSESRALGRSVTGLSIGDATDDGVDNPRTVRLVLGSVVHDPEGSPHNTALPRETVTVTYTGMKVSGNTGRRYGPFDTLGNPLAGFTREAEFVTTTQAALAAEFRNVPPEHNSPFTFEVHFSEEVALTEEMLLNSVFTVTNGTVSAARRLNPPSNIAWEITVDSITEEAVTVVLPETTDCTAAGAICTWDERPLSAEISATVAGPRVVATSVVTGAAVTNGPGDNGIWDTGESVEAEVRFSAPVTVVAPPGSGPILAILLDGTRREAAFTGGSGTDTLRFSHTVAQADNGARKARVAPNGLSLNGTTLDSDGRKVQTGFSTAPHVTAVELAADGSGDGIWTPGETVAARLAFSEAVTVAGGTPFLWITVAELPAALGYASGSGSDTLVFSTEVPSDSGSLSEIAVTADSLDANGATIASQASGIAAELGHDGTAPVASRGRIGEEATALTAAFADLPESHGGDAFTFELRFSEAFAIGYLTMRDHAFTTTNGRVTGARRLDNPHRESVRMEPNRVWEITVEPDGDDAVGITLAATTDCTAAGAVCTGDNRPLSAAVSATVPGPVDEPVDEPVEEAPVEEPPLTASFSSVPSAHDGSTAFDMNFRLSEEPHGLSHVTVRDSVFAVTGGRIERAKRLTQGSNRGWSLRVAPSGDDDVAVRVRSTTSCTSGPMMCTDDGRKLGGGLQASIGGPPPPALSVADATVHENDQAPLDFVVTLDRAPNAAATVDYATSDGTGTSPASAGSDYAATSGKLTFAVGERSRTISVTVHDDSLDEGAETMSLTLSNPSGASLADATATGTINNSDPMPKGWLARFGRAASVQTVDAIRERLAGGRRPSGENHFTVGGQRVDRMFGELRNAARGGDSDNATNAGDRAAPDKALEPGSTWDRMDRLKAEPMRRGAAPGGAARGRPGLAAGGPGSVDGVPRSRGPSPGNDRSSAGLEDVLSAGLPSAGLLSTARPFSALLSAGRDDWRALLMGSSFNYSRTLEDATGDRSGLAGWSAWGTAAETRFSGADGPLSIDGQVSTGTVGADAEWGRWLAGVAVSRSFGEGVFSHDTAVGGEVTSHLTSLNPYANFDVNERLSLWGVLGYGVGELSLAGERADNPIRTGLESTMAAFGGRGVFSRRAGGFELAVVSDALFTNTVSDAATGLMGAEGAASRLRLMLEGSGSMQLSTGGVLRPTLEAGLRYDGGDAETGAGVEIGGGLAYSAGRVSAEVNARGLVAHEDAKYEEWGFSASVKWQPNEDGRGWAMDAGSSWGDTASGVNALWSRQDASGLARGAGMDAAQRFQARLGYGLEGRKGRALWVPFFGAETAAGQQAYRMGLKLSSGPNLEAGLEIGRRTVAGGLPENAIKLQGALRW